MNVNPSSAMSFYYNTCDLEEIDMQGQGVVDPSEQEAKRLNISFKPSEREEIYTLISD